MSAKQVESTKAGWIQNLREGFRDACNVFEHANSVLLRELQCPSGANAIDQQPGESFEALAEKLNKWNVKEKVVPLIRIGLYLSFFALCEQTLETVCTRFFRKTGKDFSELKRDRGIIRSVRYLNRYCGLNSGPLLLTELKLASMIRGAFAHGNGTVATVQKEKLLRYQSELKLACEERDWEANRLLWTRFHLMKTKASDYKIVLEDNYTADASLALKAIVYKVICQLPQNQRSVKE